MSLIEFDVYMIDVEKQEWLDSLEWLVADEGIEVGYDTLSEVLKH